jgi:hypothetical protein
MNKELCIKFGKHSHRFPEKLHEQQEVSPIGYQSKRSTGILHFAGIIAYVEIVR